MLEIMDTFFDAISISGIFAIAASFLSMLISIGATHLAEKKYKKVRKAALGEAEEYTFTTSKTPWSAGSIQHYSSHGLPTAISNNSLRMMHKKSRTLFFLIDTSGSMSRAKINTVKSALKDVMPILGIISDTKGNAEIKVAIMTFSNSTKWVIDGLVNTQDAAMLTEMDFSADGLSNLGAAYIELDKRLSLDEFSKYPTERSAPPAIFLLSGGAPTDNFQSAFAQLNKNIWYKAAIKTAITVGDNDNEAYLDVLQQFTGSSEVVLEAKNNQSLKELIRTASIRASLALTRDQIINQKTSI